MTFSLKGLFALVAYAALAAFALASPSRALAAVLWNATFLALLTAGVWAIHSRARRAFWLGFVIFGGGYFAAALDPLGGSQEWYLPSTFLGDGVERLHADGSLLAVPSPLPAAPLADQAATVPLAADADPASYTAESAAYGTPVAVSATYPAPSPVPFADDSDLRGEWVRTSAHAVLCLCAALCGGALSAWFERRAARAPRT